MFDEILGVVLGVVLVVAFFLILPWAWVQWNHYFEWIEKRAERRRRGW